MSKEVQQKASRVFLALRNLIRHQREVECITSPLHPKILLRPPRKTSTSSTSTNLLRISTRVKKFLKESHPQNKRKRSQTIKREWLLFSVQRATIKERSKIPQICRKQVQLMFATKLASDLKTQTQREKKNARIGKIKLKKRRLNSRKGLRTWTRSTTSLTHQKTSMRLEILRILLDQVLKTQEEADSIGWQAKRMISKMTTIKLDL